MRRVEAEQAAAVAEREWQEVLEARENYEREQAEADEAKRIAEQERREADEAREKAERERAEAEEAKRAWAQKQAEDAARKLLEDSRKHKQEKVATPEQVAKREKKKRVVKAIPPKVPIGAHKEAKAAARARALKLRDELDIQRQKLQTRDERAKNQKALEVSFARLPSITPKVAPATLNYEPHKPMQPRGQRTHHTPRAASGKHRSGGGGSGSSGGRHRKARGKRSGRKVKSARLPGIGPPRPPAVFATEYFTYRV